MGLPDDPEYWRKRADETRARVEHWPECEYKETMFEIAKTHERMADRAEQRLDSDTRHYH